eukprot:2383219-Rhodomonas_salina.1
MQIERTRSSRGVVGRVRLDRERSVADVPPIPLPRSRSPVVLSCSRMWSGRETCTWPCPERGAIAFFKI